LSKRDSRIVQQVLTGLAGAVGRLLVVAAELLLHDAVGEAGLLLLLQLGEVLLLLMRRRPCWPGGKGRISKFLSPPTRSTLRRRDFLVMGPV
jgi:hypothetical protein